MEECGSGDVCDSGVVRHVGGRECNAFRDIFLTKKQKDKHEIKDGKEIRQCAGG